MEPGSLAWKLSRFLLSYRTKPHTTTGLNPGQLFLGQEVRSKLSLLKHNLSDIVWSRQSKQIENKNHTTRELLEGDLVWVRDYELVRVNIHLARLLMFWGK